MTECQPEYQLSDREVRLYYFTVREVSEMLKTTQANVRKTFQGKMVWYDGRWMISPTDVLEMRGLNDKIYPVVG